MTYKELLENYKKKNLSPTEEEQVKAEIEKHNAISEYLTDCLEEERKEEEGDLLSASFPSEGERDARMEEESIRFEKYVKKAIRRSYQKMGILVGAVLLVLLLFVQFGLSPIVSAIYYNPSKEITVYSEDKSSCTIYNQLGVDLNLFSEVTLPGKGGIQVQTVSEGFGKYSVIISPTVTYGSTPFTSTAGRITRGNLELYDPNFLRTPSINTFACYGLDPDSSLDYDEQMEAMNQKTETIEGTEVLVSQWYYVTLEDCLETVKGLDENGIYVAYVSLKKDLSFSEMMELLERLQEKDLTYYGRTWLGVRTSEDLHFSNGIKGYLHEEGQSAPYTFNENYPEISLVEDFTSSYWEQLQEKNSDEGIMTQHFISMLEYLGDQKEFLNMVSDDGYYYQNTPESFQNAAAYVKEKGLNYYGFACVTDKDSLLKMLEEEMIIGMVPLNWQ